MKNFLPLIIIFTLCTPLKAEEIKVLAASATSSTAASANITCLLDDACEGAWQPSSLDEGVDEGIYLQFEKAVQLYSIEMVVRKESAVLPSFKLYLNGKTTSPDDIVYQYRRDVDKAKGLVKYTFHGRDWEKYRNSLQTEAKSVFIKIDETYGDNPVKPTVQALRFYKRIPSDNQKEIKLERIAVKLPRIVQAEIQADSILEPRTAYHPAKLFDSNYDFAWSTDGNKTNGIGATLALSFASKQTIAGLCIWNGYQRSAAHFEKNGRIKELLVSSDSAKQQIQLASEQGMQKIMFNGPMKEVPRLTLKINSIYPGTKYKDVLLSEMRLIDDHGNIILPVVKRPRLQIDNNLKAFLDKSWSGFLHGISDESCFNKRLRLRSNGTFVIYRDYQYGETNDNRVSANVLEGNWAVEKGKIRIFGKQYTTELQSSDYIKGQARKKSPAAKLFQTFVTVQPYATLSKAEKDKAVNFLFKSRYPAEAEDAANLFWNNSCRGDWKENQVKGNNRQELLASLSAFLAKKNPYYIQSSVITDFVLPTAEVNACTGFY